MDNPINRYVINSPMLPDLVKNPDGGLTIYMQNSPPGSDKEANWLPAPPGPFTVFMRLYWPKRRGSGRHLAAAQIGEGRLTRYRA